MQADLFVAPLDIAVHLDDGSAVRGTVALDDRDVRWVGDVPDGRHPVRVELDPDVRLLMHSSFRERNR